MRRFENWGEKGGLRSQFGVGPCGVNSTCLRDLRTELNWRGKPGLHRLLFATREGQGKHGLVQGVRRVAHAGRHGGEGLWLRGHNLLRLEHRGQDLYRINLHWHRHRRGTGRGVHERV